MNYLITKCSFFNVNLLGNSVRASKAFPVGFFCAVQLSHEWSVAQKAADAIAKREAGERERELREKVTALTAENARLVRELQASKDSVELVRKAAMLEASQKAAEQMLQRYKDGLQDGARLSTGSIPRGLSSSRSTDLESPIGSM